MSRRKRRPAGRQGWVKKGISAPPQRHAASLGDRGSQARRGGAPVALVKNGDRVRIDAQRGKLELSVSAAELRRRKAKPPRRELSGVLAKYASLVGSAHSGAVTRPRA